MSDLPVQFVQCRTLGHAWSDTSEVMWLTYRPHPRWKMSSDTWIQAYSNGVGICVQCTRCAMIRADLLNSVTGELISRRYKYPQGYLYSKGYQRPSRSQFRLQLLAYRKATAKAGKKP